MQRIAETDLAMLMRAANAGDQEAYRRLLDRLAGVLRGQVRRGLARAGRGMEDAEDVVQEALLAVHLKRQTWDDTQPLEPWVRAIARYKLVDHLRRRGHHGHVDIDDLADSLPASTPHDEAAHVDRDRLLAGLTERQRQIVVAISIEGHSAREVGERTNMSEGAVRVALHRALKAMAERSRGGEA